MDEIHNKDERAEFLALLRKAATERDPKYADMTDRAAFIIEILQHEHPELTTWDITCFAASWLAMKSTEYVWLKDSALRSAVSVAQAHYFMDEVGLISIVPQGYITPGPRLVKDDDPSSEVQQPQEPIE